MKNITQIICMVCLILQANPGTAASKTDIIPKPVKVEMGNGHFLLNANTTIYAPSSLKNETSDFNYQIFSSTGLRLKYSASTPAKSNFIQLKIETFMQKKYGDEAYSLEVDTEGITITASDKAGVFYALQTVLQLMPVQVYSRSKISDTAWNIPCLKVLDYPRFHWRGFMLDASRSFQPLAYVKKTLDLMAMHKMNVFHWHLTDDHGWRIEIKSHPELAQIAAFRNQPNYPVKGEINPYGGYYTQKQIREIVKYAAERHITIVPEVDLPGHSSALLQAMPELTCDNVEKQKHIQYFRDYPMRNTNYIKHQGSNVVCAGKESVYPVIEDILNEIIDLFPGEYIHVGGDEVKKEWWEACPHCRGKAQKEGLKDMDELQAYFIKRLEEMVVERDRKLIGWDEILEGGLSPTASVMAWRGMKGAAQAVKQGRKTVVASNTGYYIQRNQTENPFHPQGWPRITSAKHIYEYNPIPEGLSSEQEKLILGIQTSIWTPFMHKEDLLDIGIYPRNCALSEAAWTQKDDKDWSDFESRLNSHFKRLAYRGVAYWRENSKVIGEWDTQELWKETSILKYDVTKHISKAGVYFFLGKLLDGSELIIEEASLLQDGKQIASDKHLGYAAKERNHERIYFIDVTNVNSKSNYELKLKVRGTLGKKSTGQIYLMPPF